MNYNEKMIHIAVVYNETWALYKLSILGGSMMQKAVELPALEVISRGSGKAGAYYSPRSNRVTGAHITGKIVINAAYYNGSSDSGNDATLHETIAHELAHHITYRLYPNAKQWHGPEFRAVMMALGYDGNTYHSMNVREARVIAKKDKDDDSLFEF